MCRGHPPLRSNERSGRIKVLPWYLVLGRPTGSFRGHMAAASFRPWRSAPPESGGASAVGTAPLPVRHDVGLRIRARATPGRGVVVQVHRDGPLQHRPDALANVPGRRRLDVPDGRQGLQHVGERDERDGAEPESAASSADDEPLNPASRTRTGCSRSRDEVRLPYGVRSGPLARQRSLPPRRRALSWASAAPWAPPIGDCGGAAKLPSPRPTVRRRSLAFDAHRLADTRHHRGRRRAG